ncbi:MAG: ABC transporter permease [Candidatus Kariarchaeaceae archaeon]|jgi:ABC-2 type transport system permease protein
MGALSYRDEPFTLPSYSNSKPVSSWRIIKSTIVKDLIVLKRYKANMIGQFVRTLLFIIVFWFFSVAIEFNYLTDTSTRSMYMFYLAGFCLLMYDGVALWSPFNSVTRDLYNGTLESIYSTPSSRYAYFLGGVIAQAIIATIFFLPIYITLVIISKIGIYESSMILVVTGITVVILSIFGVLVALTAILWKQVSSIISILGTLFTFVSGVLFPVQSFPTMIRYLSYLLPYTWGIDLIRVYTYNGEWDPLLPIYVEWMILGIMGIVYYLLSRFALRKVETHAKTKGLHLI